MKIRAAVDVPTLFASLKGKKGGELSENNIPAANRTYNPRHALTVAARGLEDLSPTGV